MSECTVRPQRLLRGGWITFLGQWLRDPRHVASVAPSGKQLGRLMAGAIPPDSRRVVELGAGTGAITNALLQGGVAPDALVVVEMNLTFHQLLCDRFPRVHIVQGDARHLPFILVGRNGVGSGQVDAICSSLGLLTLPADVQRDIMAAAFDALSPQGVFIQYTYGVQPPLDDIVRADLGLECRKIGMAWFNLPPARVFVYSRAPCSAPTE